MNEHEHHDAAMHDLEREYRELLETSEQGVYLYLDDVHKLCNARFARLLGYASPEEWARVQRPFPEAFVAAQSHEPLISAYQDAIDRLVASTFPATWKRQDGGTVDSTVILVPVAYQGHLLALHFVDER